MRGVVLLLCTCACKQIFGLADPQSTPDAGDARTPDDASLCWTVQEVSLSFCLERPLSGNVTVSVPTIVDTSQNGTTALCTSTSNPSICVVAAASITIGETAVLRVTGSRPLVLVANVITLNGVLDVASHIGTMGTLGASADVGPCNAGTTATGRGGGAGGSFGTRGGDGGDQDGAPNSRSTAGNAVMGATFRGGCPGTNGGGATGRGSGGGAVALLAPSIVIGTRGLVDASGAGGSAGSNDDGGSGGGSGGLIVLKTDSLTAMQGAQIYANGGGGGGAGDTNGPGQNGGDSAAATIGGQGGQGAGNDAGDGGDGYPAPTLMRNGVSGTAALAGGGGGGGGGGVIWLIGTLLPAGIAISPPPQ